MIDLSVCNVNYNLVVLVRKDSFFLTSFNYSNIHTKQTHIHNIEAVN